MLSKCCGIERTKVHVPNALISIHRHEHIICHNAFRFQCIFRQREHGPHQASSQRRMVPSVPSSSGGIGWPLNMTWQLLVYARPPSTPATEIETVLSRPHLKDKEQPPPQPIPPPPTCLVARLHHRRRPARSPVASTNRRRLARQSFALITRPRATTC